MSDGELHMKHRGFAVKAREVLLEPPAPFAVAIDSSGSSVNEVSDVKAPHRGFTAKAREVLLDRQSLDSGSHHGLKSLFDSAKPDLEIFHKHQSQPSVLSPDQYIVQKPNIDYNKKIIIPHSKLSRIKAHKMLGEAGKSRSANEIFYDKYMKQLRGALPCNDTMISRLTFQPPIY